MKLSELIERLEEIIDGDPESSDVRVITMDEHNNPIAVVDVVFVDEVGAVWIK